MPLTSRIYLKTICPVFGMIPKQYITNGGEQLTLTYKKFLCLISNFSIRRWNAKSTKITYTVCKSEFSANTELYIAQHNSLTHYKHEITATEYLSMLKELVLILKNEPFHPQKHNFGCRVKDDGDYTTFATPMSCIIDTILGVLNMYIYMLESDNINLISEVELNRIKKITNNRYEINVESFFCGIVEKDVDGLATYFNIDKLIIDRREKTWRMLGGSDSKTTVVYDNLIHEYITNVLVTILIKYEETKGYDSDNKDSKCIFKDLSYSFRKFYKDTPNICSNFNLFLNKHNVRSISLNTENINIDDMVTNWSEWENRHYVLKYILNLLSSYEEWEQLCSEQHTNIPEKLQLFANRYGIPSIPVKIHDIQLL